MPSLPALPYLDHFPRPLFAPLLRRLKFSHTVDELPQRNAETVAVHLEHRSHDPKTENGQALVDLVATASTDIADHSAVIAATVLSSHVKAATEAANEASSSLLSLASPQPLAPPTSAAPALAPAGVLVMGTVTYTLQPLNDGNLLFGSGATITAYAPPAEVDGQNVYFGAQGLVINAVSTFPVTPYGDPPPAVAVATDLATAATLAAPAAPAATETGPSSGFSQFGERKRAMTSDGNGRWEGLGESFAAIMVAVFTLLLI